MNEQRPVGFIGLGHMGGPMASNLVNRQFDVHVFDTDSRALDALRRQGATVAASAADLASACGIVVTMLPNSRIVHDVVHGRAGLLEGLHGDSVLVDMGTSDPVSTRALAGELAGKGARMVDAPVSKGIPAAQAGTLTIMAGGSQEDFQACLPVLRAMGRDIYHCGALGSGHVVKIINNLLVGVLVPVCAESLALGVKSGVDVGVLMDVITAGSGNSFVLDELVRRHVLTGDYAGVFPVDYMIKDMRLALDLARAHHVPLPFGSFAHDLYEVAHNDGQADQCYVIVAQVLERLAGVSLMREPAMPATGGSCPQNPQPQAGE